MTSEHPTHPRRAAGVISLVVTQPITIQNRFELGSKKRYNRKRRLPTEIQLMVTDPRSHCIGHSPSRIAQSPVLAHAQLRKSSSWLDQEFLRRGEMPLPLGTVRSFGLLEHVDEHNDPFRTRSHIDQTATKSAAPCSRIRGLNDPSVMTSMSTASRDSSSCSRRTSQPYGFIERNEEIEIARRRLLIRIDRPEDANARTVIVTLQVDRDRVALRSHFFATVHPPIVHFQECCVGLPTHARQEISQIIRVRE